MPPSSSSGGTDWPVTKKLCVRVSMHISIYMLGKEGWRHICYRTALHLYHGLNFSHLGISRLTIVTAPLAEIMRGHKKLDGCCIHNNIRQKATGVSVNALCSKHTLWVGPTLVSAVILCTDRSTREQGIGIGQKRLSKSCHLKTKDGRKRRGKWKRMKIREYGVIKRLPPLPFLPSSSQSEYRSKTIHCLSSPIQHPHTLI